ncbi:MAG: YceH family protein [Ilumatobacteraceae bacterium]|nr:YceH family protein [Ilumatobacteraceae bacterium]
MLTIIEGRVLGCLLEKERTTPDQYPLTLNALVLGCNQSTSREPVMQVADYEVEATLSTLKAEGLLRFVHPAHGRSVTRYRQVADESWGLAPDAAAVIAVLLLRGPQTVAELRTRTERQHRFATPEAVEDVLRELAATGRVQLLERHPGHKEARWQQLFAQEAEPSVVATSSPTAGGMAERLAQLETRVTRLESALADLLPDGPAEQDTPPPIPPELAVESFE